MASLVTELKHLEIQLEDIISATDNFKSKVIGGGGFGKVYLGELSHSQSEVKSLVAIKRLDRKYGQGDPEFLKEIRLLPCYRHENLISLLGFCCQEREMILIYEYASHGSLDGCLSSADLTWTQRLRICIDAAKGLSFLHDPNGTQQRVLHCDIKSSNILLDKNMTAKVSDFGLSKMGPANQQYSLLITSAVGTPGYCDPMFMDTYTLTKESDVYSFGVVLLEVLCGRLCVETSNGKLEVYVPFWKRIFKEERLDEIILPDLIPQMGPGSLETYADIAFQCLQMSRKERPTMFVVVEKLEESLEFQMFHDLQLPKEHQEIVKAAVPPLRCRSLEELKALLSKGFYVNNDKTWLSLNSKGERIIMVSIQDYLTSDDQDNKDYSDPSWIEEKSRFKVGFYKTCHMEFKLRVRTPLFLSPDVTYGLNLVFHCSEIENMRQQHVGIRYMLQGEKTIAIVHFADKKESKRLVVELYQFTSNEESILDLEIFLEDCGLSGDFYIEGIEFRPLEKVERQVIIANQEIVSGVVLPVLYRFTEEAEVLLSQGVLLNRGKTWLSINKKRELYALISIEDCLIRDDSDRFSLEKDSRFAVGCYKSNLMNFKIRVRSPFILSPHVTYGIYLIFRFINIEQMKGQSLPIRYKLQGESKISIVHYADAREDGWLVAELYQFTSDEDKSVLDIEIVFERCGLSGYFHTEGIEFQPLEKVEHPIREYQEILKAAVPHVFYRSAEELKVLLVRGILLKRGKMWFSLNDKEEHCLMLSIEDCLVHARLRDEYSFEKNSRFTAGCYFTKNMNFKIRFATPFFLTPHVTYGLNLVFQISKPEHMKQQYVGIRYKLQGETRISIVHFADKRVDEWLVAQLYQFTSDDKINLVFEIIFEDCGPSHYSNYWYIEGIEFQPLGRVENRVVVVKYEEILKAAVTPLFYRSEEELKLLLSRWTLLNGSKTLFCINEKGEHIEMIYIEACLNQDEIKAGSLQPNAYYKSSSFPVALRYKYNSEFKARVRAQYLSPQISYTVNLVFRYDEEWRDKVFNPLRYKLDGEDETKVVIVYPTDKREDGWFTTPLYQFTSQHTTAAFQFEFEELRTSVNVAGIEFQPCQEKVEHQVVEYQDIVRAATRSLIYTSLEELKEILCIGVHLNGYKRRFSLTEKGQHCELISMKDCLIPQKHSSRGGRYQSHYKSRFPAGFYQTKGQGFKTHVKTQFLSPSITYTVNLVFESSSFGSQRAYVDLKYRLRGEKTTSTVYLAKMRKDGLLMAELYQLTSDGSIVELEIIFDSGTSIGVEGILFQPLEKEDQMLEADKPVDAQIISRSDSEAYWEQKIPSDYEELLKLSKCSVQWKTKKELYSILCKGFVIDNGQQWFNVDENGKKCQMQSARATLSMDNDGCCTFKSSNKSRFGEVGEITVTSYFRIKCEINLQVLLSPKTSYASYLIYKLPPNESKFEAPLHVLNIDGGEKHTGWYIYLVKPPHTPFIGAKLGNNTKDSLNRPRLDGVQQRSDVWMEVLITTFNMELLAAHRKRFEPFSMNLYFEHPSNYLGGLIIEGIEIRPI